MAATAALVLAGCSGSEESAEPTVDFSDQGLEATSTTGVIRGVVVDSTIAPIASAVLAINGKNLNTTSDDSGRFGFDGLEPGTYFLTASKVGFATIQQSVDVVAGDEEPPIVRILMEPNRSANPYYLQTHHRGFISCGFLTANFVWDADSCDPTGAAGYAARDDSRPRFEVSAPPTYLQTEITWEPTQALGDQLVVIESPCESANTDAACDSGDGRLCNNVGPAPIICRMNQTHSGSRLADGTYWENNGVGLNESRLGQAGHTGFEVAVYAGCFNGCVLGAVGVGVDFEQTFDVYNTYFYGYEPPADWSLLKDGTVPPPPK